MDNERCVSELLNCPFQRLHLVFHTPYLCECCCQHVRSLHSSAAPSSPLLMCIAVYTAAPKFADGIDPVSSQINISISRVDTGVFQWRSRAPHSLYQLRQGMCRRLLRCALLSCGTDTQDTVQILTDGAELSCRVRMCMRKAQKGRSRSVRAGVLCLWWAWFGTVLGSAR